MPNESSSRDNSKESLQQDDEIMEHYKKRLIHQLENPQKNDEVSNGSVINESNGSEQNGNAISQPGDSSTNSKPVEETERSSQDKNSNELETSNASSTNATTTNPEKKKEVKIPRRKSVSRSQYRHENIQVFKPGPSKYNLMLQLSLKILECNTETKCAVSVTCFRGKIIIEKK